ncbi:hypothetical protein PG996_000385 [Apiospora saccharicola]|uniref:Uncharacterized protein n=1 Tax=Apiospora saccharicola TaxID=335842 RepID=A0ABR1WHF5_9PEZI
MLSPTRANPDVSQNEELLRTAKSLRLRFADDEPVSIDASLSQQASDTKKPKTVVPFAPFRASYGNLALPKARDTTNQGHPGYSGLDHTKQHPYVKARADSFARDAVNKVHKGYNSFDYIKERPDGFSPFARNALVQNTGYTQEPTRKNGSYNGSHSMSDPNHIGIERQYREERSYTQDYRSPQPQQSYYPSPRPYSHGQQYPADPLLPNTKPQQPPAARPSRLRSRSRSPSPEPPVVTELEERYHKLRLALHSKAVDGFEEVEKKLTDEVVTSVNAIFDPVAQLDRKLRQVLAPLSDGEAQLSIVSTQDNGQDTQRSQTVQINNMVMEFESILANAQAEIELIGKELLAKPSCSEDSGSSEEGRRGKGTKGMKSKLDGLLAELKEDLECMSSDAVEEMSRYEKKFCEKVNSETGKIMAAFFAGKL